MSFSTIGSPGEGKIPIQIQILAAQGLSLPGKAVPHASVSVQITDVPAKVSTEFRPSSNPTWNENTPRIHVKDGALVSFIVKHQSPFFLKTTIATSPQFPIQELLNRQTTEGVDKSMSIPLSSGSTSWPLKSATLQVKVFPRAYNRPEDLAKKDKRALRERMMLTKQKSLQAAGNLESQFSVLASALRGSPMEPLVDVALTLLDALKIRLGSTDSAMHGDVIANVVHDATEAFSVVKNTRDGRSASLTAAFYRELLIHTSQVLWLSDHRLLSGANPPLEAKLLTSIRFYQKYEQEMVSGVIHTGQSKKSKNAEIRDILVNNPDLCKLKTVSVSPSHLYHPPTAYYSDSIRKLTKWALTSLKTNPTSIGGAKTLFWMYGSASCGKTQTAAQLVDCFDHLGLSASYFSFNESGQRRTSALLEHLAGTLAYQISISRPEVAQYVCDTVKNHPNIRDKPLDTQMRELVIGPLNTMVKERRTQGDNLPVKPLLIVLDDVDRCSVEEQHSLATLLHQTFVGQGNELPAPSFVRVLVVSRYLEVMKATFGSNYLVDKKGVVLHEIVPNVGYVQTGGASSSSSRNERVSGSARRLTFASPISSGF